MHAIAALAPLRREYAPAAPSHCIHSARFSHVRAGAATTPDAAAHTCPAPHCTLECARRTARAVLSVAWGKVRRPRAKRPNAPRAGSPAPAPSPEPERMPMPTAKSKVRFTHPPEDFAHSRATMTECYCGRQANWTRTERSSDAIRLLKEARPVTAPQVPGPARAAAGVGRTHFAVLR